MTRFSKGSSAAPLKTLVLLGASTLALGLAGCRHQDPARVAGWTLVDATQRHPILVSQQPTTLSVRVARGSYGLNPQQRADVLDFAERYRAADAGNSRLVVSAPGGAANEVAAMHAVDEIRGLLADRGFNESSIVVEAYHAEGESSPPVRVSYMRYVAEAPQCGIWPTNLGEEPQNLPFPNLGCATQRNFAAQVANPADLLGPRSETDRDARRRDAVYTKYIQGQSSATKKVEDEKIQVQQSN